VSIIEKALEKLEKARPGGAGTGEGGVPAATEPDDGTDWPPPAAVERYESEEPVEAPRHTQYSVSLDLATLDRMGVLTPGCRNRQVIEEYRRIKRPVLVTAFSPDEKSGRSTNVVLVTSSVEEEGKTHTALNLAMSVVSEVDRTVLLIDGDAVKHSLSKHMGIAERPGLTDYLSSPKAQLPDLLVKTNIPTLTVLPAGTRSDNLAELWASIRMQKLMSELSRRYDDRLVIIDSPPLLQQSAVSVLAALVGQTVMVIEAEKTPRHIVETALGMLDRAGKIAIVLNKSNQRFDDQYAYDYY
jgi:exopolysaccharide/PEP-CTERM locus tyrosine autokinase